MKISEIISESSSGAGGTSSGSVATVSQPMNSGPLKRVGQGVYKDKPNKSGDNLLTGKKTNKKFANSVVFKESAVPLKFHTIELEPKYYKAFTISNMCLNGFENLTTHDYMYNLRLIGEHRDNWLKLTETKEFDEIQPFIEAINRIDSKKKIKVGDKFAVLFFEIIYFQKRVVVLGHTKPVTVTKIHLHSDGTINYLLFDNNQRYPRFNSVTLNKREITQAAYFSSEQDAKKALAWLRLSLPDGWEFDTSDLDVPNDRSGLYEGQQTRNKITDDEQQHKTARILN